MMIAPRYLDFSTLSRKPSPAFALAALLLLSANWAAGSDSVAVSTPPLVQGQVNAVTVDAGGNRYICGTFFGAGGTLDFNPGIGSDLKTGVAGADAFVTRFNADGSYGWTQTFVGSGNESANALAISGTVVYVTGTFTSADAGIGAAGTVASSGTVNTFIIALNTNNGTAVANFGVGGIQKFGGTGSDSGFGIAATPSGVYVTGDFTSTNVGIGGLGTIGTSGSNDAFVIGLNPVTGAALPTFGTSGIQKFGGTGADFGRAITIVGSNLYMAGNFNSANAGIGGTGSLSTSGLSDAFVVALTTSTGAPVNTFGASGILRFGGAGQDTATAISAFGSNLFVAGSFSSNNAGIGGTGTFATTGLNDAFVMAVNANSGSPVGGFGTGGLQKFGGSGDDFATGIVATSSVLYVTGNFASANAGINGTGAVASAGGPDAFVLALNSATGGALPGFGPAGAQAFGGSNADFGTGVATAGSVVFMSGQMLSNDAGINGKGPFASGNGISDGVLLPLNATTGAPAFPTITSRLYITGTYSQPFNYTLTSNPGGATFTASGLPAGLTLNGSTGVISGSASVIGSFQVPVTASGAAGTVTATLSIAIATDAVARTSPPIVEGLVLGTAVDASDNVYICGQYSGTVDFNLGAGGDIRQCVGSLNAFVTRFNSDGTYAWTQTFGGSGNDGASCIAVSGGTVYVGGNFNSLDAGFNGPGGNFALGQETVFILGLDAVSGAPLGTFGSGGVQKFGGSAFDTVAALTVGAGNLYFVGSLSSSDAGVGKYGTIATSGKTDAYVVALNAITGNVVPTFANAGFQKFGGAGDDSASSVVVAGGNVYVAGTSNSVSGGIGGSGPFNPAGDDAFVMALNATTGTAVNAFGSNGVQQFGGSSSDRANAMVVSGGVLYLAGAFQSTNAGIGGTGAAAATGSTSAFLVALNSTNGKAISGFGTNGIQTFGGSAVESIASVVVAGTSLYAVGTMSSTDAGFGAKGSFASSGTNNAFILAMNAVDGTPQSGFGTGGFQKFGGSTVEFGYSVAASSNAILAGGYFTSTDAGVGGRGPFDGSQFGGFLLRLNTATGTTGGITSPLKVGGVLSTPFSYTITGTPAPTAYSAANLPAGLTVDTSTGIISGKVSSPGTYSVTIGISTSLGKFFAPLSIDIIKDGVAKTYPPVTQGEVQSIAVDAAGNRYVTGAFFNTVDFNPAVGVDVKSASSTNAYVTRYNADGSYAWTQTFGGTFYDYAYGVVVFGNTVYVCGALSSLDAGFGGHGKFGPIGSNDAFVAALDAGTGQPATGFGVGGVQQFGGTGMSLASAFSVAANANGLYVVGQFQGSNFGIGAPGIQSGAGGADAFILGLDPKTGAALPNFGFSGFFGFEGSGNDVANGVTIAGSNIYVTGQFTSSDAFLASDSGPYAARGLSSAFVLALDGQSGTPVSTFGRGGLQMFGGTGFDYGYAVAAANGIVYVGGGFSSTDAVVGMGSSGVSTSNSAGSIKAGTFAPTGSYDGFVLALDQTTGMAVSTFGTGGLQKFGGTGHDYILGLAVSGGKVYASGSINSQDAGIGGPGTIKSVPDVNGGDDAFVIALNASTGAAVTSFGSGGAQVFGGSMSDSSTGMAVFANQVIAVGGFSSIDAGLNGIGTFDSTGFGSFMLSLDSATGAATPSITSSLTASGVSGQSFSYTITAGPQASSFTATPLPGGLTLSGNTISGTLPATGVYPITLAAANSFGTGPGATLSLSVSPAPLAVSAIAPASGSTIGGTMVTISGQGFSAGAAVTIGGALASSVSVANATTLTCVTPPSTAGVKDVTVSVAPGSATLPQSFTYVAQVTVASVVPNSGSTTGGTHITINGQNFAAGATVSIGGTAATSVQVVNATTIFCNTPANTQGAKDVVVTVGPTAATLTNGFIYFNPLPPVVVSGITPNFGFVDGGDAVTITGSGFPANAVVLFGTVPATSVVVVNATTVTCLTPANTAGAKDVTVGFGSAIGRLPGGFIYLPSGVPPSIDLFQSSQNPSLIGTSVNFFLLISDGDTGSVKYGINFGDGSPALTGVTLVGNEVAVTHTFASAGDFSVVASVSDGGTPVQMTLIQTVLSPNSGGDGVPNVSQDTPPVENPDDGLTIGVGSSNGGVITLNIDVTGLRSREPLTVTTIWGDISGRTSTVTGLAPVHQFTRPGVFVAFVTARNSAGVVTGKGRKTLAISASETGTTGAATHLRKAAPATPGPLLMNASNTAIAFKSVTGKFVFAGGKADTVSFSGSFLLPAGFDPAQTHEFSMGIGNIVANANVDPRGTAKQAGGTPLVKKMKLSYAVKKGHIASGNETAKIDTTFTTAGMVAAGFDTEGISKSSTGAAANKPVPRMIQVAFQLDGAAYQALIPVQFSITKDSAFGSINSRH